nr:hypothetical protein [Tanacetum cinerariifolium]
LVGEGSRMFGADCWLQENEKQPQRSRTTSYKRLSASMMMVLMRQIVSCDMLDHMVMTDKMLLVDEIETADTLADVVDTVFCSTDAGRSKQ